MSPPAVLPSVTCHGVGTLIAIISQLNTLPACAPVNASMAALRLATHDSESGWLASPFLCDSFIHYSTPVLSRRTTRAVRPDQFEKLTAYLRTQPALEVIYRFKQRLCYLLLQKHRTRKTVPASSTPVPSRRLPVAPGRPAAT